MGDMQMEEIRRVYPLNVAYVIFGGEGSAFDFDSEKTRALCNNETFLEDYNNLLSTLADDERVVIEKLFRDLKSVDETASEMNLDREYVNSFLYPKAIRKLRHPSRSRWWYQYLPRAKQDNR